MMSTWEAIQVEIFSQCSCSWGVCEWGILHQLMLGSRLLHVLHLFIWLELLQSKADHSWVRWSRRFSFSLVFRSHRSDVFRARMHFSATPDLAQCCSLDLTAAHSFLVVPSDKQAMLWLWGHQFSSFLCFFFLHIFKFTPERKGFKLTYLTSNCSAIFQTSGRWRLGSQISLLGELTLTWLRQWLSINDMVLPCFSLNIWGFFSCQELLDFLQKHFLHWLF